MAPRMYPHYDSDAAIQADIKSDGATGEIEVYKLLRNTLPNDWVVLYNTHIRAFKDSQSDFYVVVPGKGIVNVDAKGFNYSYHDNAFWLKDKVENEEKRIDIIDHADKAIKNMSAYIKRTILGLSEHQEWGAYGKVIVFACEDIQGRERVPGDHPCIFRSEIEADRSIIKRKIEAELDFTSTRVDCQKYFTRERMEQIVSHFIVKHPAINRSLDFRNNDTMMGHALTCTQNTICQSILRHKYVHVRGGAGTGKTMIAKCVANKIASDSQKKVLYVCFNVNLAECVAKEIRRTNVKVLNFHRLGQLIRRNDLCVYSSDKKRMDRLASDANIHAALASEFRGKDKFDALVIDEAQDLTADNLKCLLGLAKRDRHVAIFSDEYQTIFSLTPRNGAQQPWEFPQTEVFGTEEVYTPDPLSTNIRNTDRIFLAFKRLSEEETLPGEIIEGVEITRTTESCKEIVRKLREKNYYSPCDIAVLAPKRELLPSGDDIFTDKFDVWRGNCKVLRATIQSFKGLEANCVLFLGEKQCSDELKYEAMSRAKYELYLVE